MIKDMKIIKKNVIEHCTEKSVRIHHVQIDCSPGEYESHTGGQSI